MLLDGLLGQFRWWRRRRGGHWERWYLNDGQNRVWMPVDECSLAAKRRPGPDCLGTPTCETW